MWLRTSHLKGYKKGFSLLKKIQRKNQGLFRKITVHTRIRKNIALVQKVS